MPTSAEVLPFSISSLACLRMSKGRVDIAEWYQGHKLSTSQTPTLLGVLDLIDFGYFDVILALLFL